MSCPPFAEEDTIAPPPLQRRQRCYRRRAFPVVRGTGGTALEPRPHRSYAIPVPPPAPGANMTPNHRIAAIREKVEAGQRLSFDDGVFLYDEADLFTLGELANIARERKNGQFTY